MPLRLYKRLKGISHINADKMIVLIIFKLPKTSPERIIRGNLLKKFPLKAMA